MVKSNIIDHLKFEIIENTSEVRVELNDHPFLIDEHRYYCLAEIVNQNNNLITGEGKIIDDHGLVVAQGIGTFKLI